MNLKRIAKRIVSGIRGKLLVQLWLAIMLLVFLAILFLWVVQIWLFEPNYLDAAMENLITQVEDISEEISQNDNIELGNTDNSLHYLSKTISGKVFLVNSTGDILYAYNRALLTNKEELAHEKDWFTDHHYQQVLKGMLLREVFRYDQNKIMVFIGVSTTYRGEPAVIMLYNQIEEVNAVLALNRKQLLILSIVLTLTASVLSFLLARYFEQPILKIQQTVKRLTDGDLTAVPEIKRGDEIGKLAESVEDLAEELLRVDVLRKEVIANVSHELRAPLSLITGYSEMVRDVTGADAAIRNQNLDLVIKEANRLSEMVDDIMDYSQLQAGYSKLKTEECNLVEVVESSIEYARAIANQYEIPIRFKSSLPDILVDVDALKISQVLRNLLNNAINHTEDGKEIIVEMIEKDGKIRVSIINYGETIPPEQIKIIWERYQRVQHQGGRREGTGIGLTIVSTILTAHKMHYGAESENGRSCFWFEVTRLRK